MPESTHALETRISQTPWRYTGGIYIVDAVGEIMFEVRQKYRPDCERDAQLAASAPEMYAALKAVDEWGTNPDGPMAWEVLAQVREAIAKAETEVKAK